jgi:hypothetical protein
LWGLTIPPGVLAIADEAIEYRYFLLQRIRSLLAQSRPTEAPAILSAFGVEQTRGVPSFHDAIRYCALHATIASGRVRLATDGGAKIAR